MNPNYDKIITRCATNPIEIQYDIFRISRYTTPFYISHVASCVTHSNMLIDCVYNFVVVVFSVRINRERFLISTTADVSFNLILVRLKNIRSLIRIVFCPYNLNVDKIRFYCTLCTVYRKV